LSPLSGASLGLGEWPDEHPEQLAFERAESERYVDGGLIGRGGMGEIRSVHDARLGRVVALKTPVINDRATVHQFVAEATLTARLVHPSIVAIHDAGCTQEGRPYYTMPIVQGRSLADAIAESSSLAERLRLVRHFLDACEAIAYAHSQAVLHRDLKPGNILVGRFGETLVVDWGLAGPVGARPPGIIGTPGYMPPEQQRGEALQPSADVFALGVTLRELVHCEPGTPPELRAIIDRATDPSPEQRYVDGRALAADVGAWFEGRRVAAHRYGIRDLLARAWTHHRVPLSIGLFALLSIAVAITIGAWRTGIERARAQESERIALAALERAERNLAQAEIAQALGAASEDAWAEAELLAAGARIHGPSPVALGVLARFDSSARPRLLQRDAMPLDGSSDEPDEQAWITGTTEHWIHDGQCVSTQWCEIGGHGAPGAVSVVPDGSRVTACQDGSVLVWREQSGIQELLRLPTALGGPLVLAPSRDDPRHVALGLAGGSAAVLDLDEARIVRTFATATGTPFDLALAGSRLALSDDRGSVYVWELDSGALVVRLSAREARVRWLDDGRRLRMIGSTIEDWELPVSLARPHVRPTGVGIAALSLSPDGRFVITAHGDGRVRLGRLDASDTLVEIPLHASVVKDVEFSPDGRQAVAACAQDRRMHLLDLAEPRRVRTVPSEPGSRVAWLRGDVVQLTPYLGGIHSWRDGEGEPIITPDFDVRVVDMTSDPDREGASAITSDGGVWRLSANPGAPARLIARRPEALAIAGDAEQILIATNTGIEQITADGSRSIALPGSRVTELALSPDGWLLAVGRHDGSLDVLSTSTLEHIAVMHGHTGRVSALAFDAEGAWLISGSWDGDIRQWSMHPLALEPAAALAEAERAWGLTLDELLRARAQAPM
jgi:WD40 repeat protein